MLTGIGPGNYEVTVTDIAGCTATALSEVAEYQQIELMDSTVNASGAGLPDGAVFVTSVTGGSPPFGFAWSNGTSGQHLLDVPPGGYSVVVTDAEGCSATFYFTVDVEVAAVDYVGEYFSVSVSPNPAGAPVEKTQLLITSNIGQTIHCQVFGIDGRSLREFEVAVQATGNTIPLEVPELPGIYSILLRSSLGEKIVLKWMVF